MQEDVFLLEVIVHILCTPNAWEVQLVVVHSIQVHTMHMF